MSARATRGEWLAALAALAALYLAVGVADHEVWTPTEPSVAGIVWNMWDGAGLAVPRINAFPYLEKPPLYYWAALLAARANGALSAGSLRLPAALFGLLGIGALGAALARRHGSRLGLVGALLAATTLPVYEIAHRASTDVAAFALCCVAFAIFARGLEAPAAGGAPPRSTGRADLALAAVLGVAFYAKNLYVLLVVAPPVAFSLVAAGEGRRALRLGAAALLATALCAAPWALALHAEGGAHFLRVAFFDNALGRFLDLGGAGLATGPLNDALVAEKEPSPLFYLVRLPALAMPWLGLALAGLAQAARERPLDAGRRFALAGLLGIPLVLTLSTSKATEYLLPAAFFGAWWSAEALARPGGPSSRAARLLVLANLGLVAALLCAAPLAAAVARGAPWLGLATPALAAAAWPLARAARRDGLSPRLGLRAGVFAALGLAVAVFAFVPLLDARKSYAPFFRVAVAETAGRRVLVPPLGDHTLPLLNFYLGRRLEVRDDAALRAALRSDQPVAVFLPARRLDREPGWLALPGVREAPLRGRERLALLWNDASPAPP